MFVFVSKNKCVILFEGHAVPFGQKGIQSMEYETNAEL